MSQEYTIGMKVSFGRPNGEKTIGKIVKVNRTKVKIEQTEIRGRQKTHRIGTVWTVPMDARFITILDSNVDAPESGEDIVSMIHRFGGEFKVASTEKEIFEQISNIYCGLSPENISCDGEASRSSINRRRAKLNRQLRACEAALGVKVSEWDAYTYLRDN
jgi:hypothetical protein